MYNRIIRLICGTASIVSLPVEGTISSLWNGKYKYTQDGSTLTVEGLDWNNIV